MNPSAAALFGALFPETLLTIGALFILVADLLVYRGRSVTERHRALCWWTLATLVLAGVFYAIQGPGLRVNFGGGMLVLAPLNLFFKELMLVFTAITVFFSMEEPISEHVGEYFAMLLFATLGLVLLVSSENLLMIFVSLELLSLALYVLVGFQKRILRSAEAALKYFVFGAVSSGFLLFGLSYVYGATHTLNLQELAAAFKADPMLLKSPLLLVGVLFSLVGFGFKVAVVPFHLWAPDAYEGAAAPITAFLASGSKVASFVALTKFLLIGLAPAAGSMAWGAGNAPFRPGWAPFLAVLAALSMIWGNLAAIGQTNLKRLLAYSSIAHAGYILVALVGANSWSAPAVYFYVTIYALTNLGAFGIVTALANKVGGDDLIYFRGVWKRAPGLTVLMLFFMLSLAGIPPLAGFFGKFYLFAAGLHGTGPHLGLLWLVIVGVLFSAVSFYYYLKVLKVFYVQPPGESASSASLISICPCQRWPMVIIALLIFVLGWAPFLLLDPIRDWLR